MKKRRTTLADIARLAGVSLMTVSRAVNQKPGVSEEVRNAVLALAEEMDYQPNHAARGLVTRKTYAIGLVVPDNTNPFFAQIVRGVEDTAYERNYNIFLLNTVENPEREIAALNSLWQKNIDGIVLCSSCLPSEELERQVERFPAVVMVNREIKTPVPNLVTINVNDQRGAQMAVQRFLDQGCDQIACINGPATSISTAPRLEGYRSALKAANIPFDAQMVECCAPDPEAGRAAAAALLARRPNINAIYAFNDLAAFGAIQACQEAGKKVPQDVAVIGVDDTPLATIIRPRLTVLHVNLVHVGRLAMRTLLNMIEGESLAGDYLIEPELYARDSG